MVELVHFRNLITRISGPSSYEAKPAPRACVRVFMRKWKIIMAVIQLKNTHSYNRSDDKKEIRRLLFV